MRCGHHRADGAGVHDRQAAPASGCPAGVRRAHRLRHRPTRSADPRLRAAAVRHFWAVRRRSSIARFPVGRGRRCVDRHCACPGCAVDRGRRCADRHCACPGCAVDRGRRCVDRHRRDPLLFERPDRRRVPPPCSPCREPLSWRGGLYSPCSAVPGSAVPGSAVPGSAVPGSAGPRRRRPDLRSPASTSSLHRSCPLRSSDPWRSSCRLRRSDPLCWSCRFRRSDPMRSFRRFRRSGSLPPTRGVLVRPCRATAPGTLPVGPPGHRSRHAIRSPPILGPRLVLHRRRALLPG